MLYSTRPPCHHHNLVEHGWTRLIVIPWRSALTSEVWLWALPPLYIFVEVWCLRSPFTHQIRRVGARIALRYRNDALRALEAPLANQIKRR